MPVYCITLVGFHSNYINLVMLMLVRRNPSHVTLARSRATTNQSEFSIQNNIAAEVISLAYDNTG